MKTAKELILNAIQEQGQYKKIDKCTIRFYPMTAFSSYWTCDFEVKGDVYYADGTLNEEKAVAVIDTIF